MDTGRSAADGAEPESTSRGELDVPRAITQSDSGAGKAGTSSPGSRARRALHARGRLLAALFAAIALLAIWRSSFGVARAGSIERSLALHLHRRGLEADPKQILWLAPTPDLFGERPAIFVAHAGQELHDVYFAQVRVVGSAVLDARSLTNITRTSSADEDQIAAVGPFVAYPARVGAVYDALVVLDTRGEPAALTAHWPWFARLQNAITNLQDSGRMQAFGIRRYNFSDAPDTLQLTTEGARFSVSLAGRRILISPWHDAPVQGAEAVELERGEKGKPGLITWVVDTARRVPWIGRGPVEWLEHKVFGLTDKANRAYHEVVTTDTAAEVKEALAVPDAPVVSTPAAQLSAEHHEEVLAGWPPAPIQPVLPGKVRGEGAWLPVADGFAPEPVNGKPLFYQTFLRVDPERAFTRVYITVWDSRQVQLGIVMGTKEPESATGETGDGEIPRDPFVASHLVAAFNGGFQAMHGEFGMMAERRVYLPPKPYAATVAVFEDGRVGMGSWPGPGRRAWDEELANSQIPTNMIAMRQNLTSVVEGREYNPWQRWWWGAAPEWADEQTYIPRSGLCLTSDGVLAYFWGESMGPEELGKAMLAARCERGLHLDMNGKHTGFEFYRGFAPGVAMPPVGHALTDSEYSGTDIDLRGYHYRARLAVKSMTPQRFPRYLERDPRDFFYLTRKPLLPGADVTLAGQRVAFETDGMPDAGFPHALARATVSGANAATLTRIDVTRAVPAPFADTSATRVLATLTSAARAPSGGSPEVALQAGFQHGRLRMRVGPVPQGADVLLRGPLISATTLPPEARVGLGVDADGFLIVAEAGSAEGLRAALLAAGVESAIALAAGQLTLEPLSAADAGVPGTVQGTPPSEGPGRITFLAETRPAADVLFRDVKPMPYRRWGWLQDQRVRYFPSHPARFPTPEAVR